MGLLSRLLASSKNRTPDEGPEKISKPAADDRKTKPDSGSGSESGKVKLGVLGQSPAAARQPARPAGPQLVTLGGLGSGGDEEEERRVVHPPVLMDESEVSSWSEAIRIKAQPSRDDLSCVFLVDRPVLEGYSAWYENARQAKGHPLAEAIFEVEGVDTILLHGMTVRVARRPDARAGWEMLAKAIGARIRKVLKAGGPVVAPEFFETMPAEDAIRQQLTEVIDHVINPGVASHGGVIELTKLEGNTATIRMGGGCQGCAASTLTLREGVHRAFRDAVPELGAILDETDHAAGRNPFFKEIPEEMKAHASS